MKIERRRVLFGFAAAAIVATVTPSLTRAEEDDDDDDDDEHAGGGYRSGEGYRHGTGNRPNGNPTGNNITDQPGMSYQQSRRAGGESRETVYDNEGQNRPAQAWLMTAMSANATEIETGNLAQGRAGHQDVRRFGQLMVEHHSEELRELHVLARKYGVEPIHGPVMPTHRRLVENLTMRSGEEFDRFYMRSMVLEHRTDIAEYEMAVRELPRDIAMHAANTLPILREHLAMAEDLARREGADLSGT